MTLLGAAWSAAPVHGRDPLFVKRGLDADVPCVGVHDVGIDATLHHGGRQVDAVGGQDLHQRFGDDAAAVVAAHRAEAAEILGLEHVDLYFQADSFGHVHEEVAEKGACRACADHRDARTVFQLQIRLFAHLLPVALPGKEFSADESCSHGHRLLKQVVYSTVQFNLFIIHFARGATIRENP